jgi:integral membrane protein (TIGR00529 family)
MLALFLLFILIVILVRLKLPIGVALLAGAIFLGIYHFGFSKPFWQMLYASLVNIRSWKLVVTVALILTFAHIFEDAGYVRTMVSSLETFLPPAWVARVAPSIIGLLPMPGGAMVSAPIVRQLGADSDISPEQFTASNYWWRHVWETTWPLYPSIILAAAVLKVSVWDIAIINFPISVACILSGFLLKKVSSSRRKSGGFNLSSLLGSLWPIAIIVLLGLVFRIDLIISVLVVTAVIIFIRRIPRKIVLDGLKGGFLPTILLLIFGVMTLMYTIENTGTATNFYTELLHYNIPSGMIVFAVPFVVGFLTGITSAYIGVGFPVVLPLLGVGDLTYRAGMLMAFAGGFMGVMASPVHLCLVLTNDYFRASLPRTLLLLAIPIILTSIVSWALAATIYG